MAYSIIYLKGNNCIVSACCIPVCAGAKLLARSDAAGGVG